MTHSFSRAILTVSFGTSVRETRTKTLESIEQMIRSKYPDYIHKCAWTSKLLRTKVLEAEGLNIPGVREALIQLKSDGVRKVYIQPTFVTNGSEYQKLLQEATEFQDQFDTLRLGSPLMTSAADFTPIITALTMSAVYPLLQADELLLFIGHGTTNGDNFLYDHLDKAFQSCGIPNIFLKTMQSPAAVDEIITAARERRISQITLAPFMIVAGSHALKDIAGSHCESWKSRLEQAGFRVHCEMKGLGEIPEIQQLFLRSLEKLFI